VHGKPSKSFQQKRCPSTRTGVKGELLLDGGDDVAAQRAVGVDRAALEVVNVIVETLVDPGIVTLDPPRLMSGVVVHPEAVLFRLVNAQAHAHRVPSLT
jgi:hypothetical protein